MVSKKFPDVSLKFPDMLREIPCSSSKGIMREVAAAVGFLAAHFASNGRKSKNSLLNSLITGKFQ
jgi:hypothetical protein